MRRFFGRVWLLASCLGSIGATRGFAAHPLDTWTWRNPQPARFDMRAVAYGAGTYVAAGYEGAVATSTDGIHWITRRSGTQATLNGVAFGGGQFVAVGSGSPRTILTSPNGIDWVSRSSSGTTGLSDVTWQDGLFVAVGQNGTLLNSGNGVNWTPRNPGTVSSLFSITYGDGKFVAAGSGGAIVSSANGIDWTASIPAPNRGYTSVAYGNGRYVAGANFGFYATSTNGIDWTTYTNRLESTIAAVSFGNGFFVAACSGSTFAPPRFYTSVDGLSWQSRYFLADGFLQDLLFGPDGFVAVGASTVVTSPDGVAWTQRSWGRTATMRAMAAHDDIMVAVGDNAILTSSNGIDWIEAESVSPAVGRDVLWANGRFVAVGDNGMIQSSTNGFHWVRENSPVTETLEGVAWGNGLFVAVGFAKILVSSNGTTWTSLFPGFGPSHRDVIYADGHFVAVGPQGKVSVSTNGTNWTTQTVNSFSDYSVVAYGNGVWVVGGGSPIIISTNLSNWTMPALSFTPNALTWANGVFLAGSRDNLLVSSSNGVDWALRSGSFIFLYGLAYHRGSFWGVGHDGMIQQSDPIAAAPPVIARQPRSTTALPETTTSLSAIATGTSPFTFQWQKDGVNIPGATNFALVLLNVHTSSTGNYAVVVSNGLGSTNSESASVTLATPPDPTAHLGIRSATAREFTLTGASPRRYVIWQSSDVSDPNSWIPLKTIMLPRLPPFGEAFTWIDETQAGAARRFYRATLIQ